jgi:hypothetical protein
LAFRVIYDILVLSFMWHTNLKERAKMGKHRSALLVLGMLACSALIVVAMAGFVSSLRPQRSTAPAPAVKTTAKSEAIPKMTATPASKPEPITSVDVPILMYHHLEALSGDQASDPDYQQLFVALRRSKIRWPT